MAFPDSMTLIPVVGRVAGIPDGVDLHVTFFCDFWQNSSVNDVMVPPFTILGDVGVEGAWSTDLPPTDHPDWSPQDWEYRVIVQYGNKFFKGVASVPHDAVELDLSDIILVDVAPEPGVLYIPVTQKNQPNGVAGLDSGGLLLESQLPLSIGSPEWADITGKPSTFPPSAHTEPWASLTGVPATFPPNAHGHVIGDTTGLQAALDLKAPLASPAFTGTVTGVSKAMVGLGNADDTSDANKPVSTAQLTALNLKAPLASPAFTGTVTGISKTMVGLSNVDNTSDAAKPISSATLLGLAQTRRPSDNGYSGWMWPPDMVQSSFVIITSGLGYTFRMRFFSSLISTVHIHVVTPASGLTANQCYATVHNDAGVILGVGAITADQSGQWTSGGLKNMNLAVAQAAVPGDYYKVRLWFNGTTGPALSRAGSSSSAIINAGLAAPNLHYSTTDTGLTDVTSGTVTKANLAAQTGANVAVWCALS